MSLVRCTASLKKVLSSCSAISGPGGRNVPRLGLVIHSSPVMEDSQSPLEAVESVQAPPPPAG